MNNSLMSFDELISSVNGELINSSYCKDDFSFTSVATDSRNVVEKSLFIPLIGENQNGHKYCPQAIEKGASVIFINKSEYLSNKKYYDDFVISRKNIFFITVENTLTALQNAAEFYVSKFPNLIKIAITGSSGKTTSKEMVVTILKQKYKVVYTQGNFNSETGLPLSVFNIRNEHEVGVFEMGMNRKDEIKEISKVLKANYALVTNIGTAHIGILGSRKNIADEKRHVFDYITESGAAFIPALDDFADFLGEKVKGEVVNFGSFVPSAKSGVHYICDCGISGTDFSVDNIKIHLQLSGVYNYTNALGAIAIGKKLNVSAEQIKKGLEELSPIFGRMETELLVIKSGMKITLIKDCYNANPDSMKNVLSFCKSLKSVNQLIYVIGDMLELGEKSIEAHEAIGCIIAADKPAMAIFVGEEMKYAYQKAYNRGFINGVYVPNTDESAIKTIAKYILDKVQENDVLLIKASRGIALERIVPEIIKDGESR